jgi:hypothetical protein
VIDGCWALGCVNVACDGLTHRRLNARVWIERPDGENPLPVADEDWLIQHAIDYLQRYWTNHHAEAPAPEDSQRYAVWALQVWRQTPEGQRWEFSHPRQYRRWLHKTRPTIGE